MESLSQKTEAVPTKLVYYGTEDLIHALWNEEIKVTSPSDFNDPFEFLPAFPKNSEEAFGIDAQYCMDLQQASDGRFYALCLSRKANDVRMWAQYGGNHTGIMLTIDFTQLPLKDLHDAKYVLNVDYDKPTRHQLDWQAVKKGTGLTLEDTKALLSKKGSDWSHERETRVLLSSSMFEGANNTGLHGRFGMWQNRAAAFLQVPTSCITNVTLGMRSPISLFSAVQKIRDVKAARWAISKAKYSPDTFELREDVIFEFGAQVKSHTPPDTSSE